MPFDEFWNDVVVCSIKHLAAWQKMERNKFDSLFENYSRHQQFTVRTPSQFYPTIFPLTMIFRMGKSFKKYRINLLYVEIVMYYNNCQGRHMFQIKQ